MTAYKRFLALMLAFSMLFLLIGCDGFGGKETEKPSENTTEEPSEKPSESEKDTDETTEKPGDESTTDGDSTTEPPAPGREKPEQSAVKQLPIWVHDDLFTARDVSGSYTRAGSAIVTLADGASSSASANVSITGDRITVKGEGVYIFSGSLTNGAIVVDATKDDKVQLVFEGVNVNCASSAALYIKQANKVFVTSAPGTENTLSVSGDYVAIDGNNIDGAVFAKDDVVFNGTGKLTVNAPYGSGIVAKDDVKFTAGTYKITAAHHAVNANDSIRIAGGTFDLTAGTDGLHAINSDSPDTLGYICIETAKMKINAGSDGMEASADFQINAGEYDVTAVGRGFKTESSLQINGGTFTVECFEDWFVGCDDLFIYTGAKLTLK